MYSPSRPSLNNKELEVRKTSFCFLKKITVNDILDTRKLDMLDIVDLSNTANQQKQLKIDDGLTVTFTPPGSDSASS